MARAVYAFVRGVARRSGRRSAAPSPMANGTKVAASGMLGRTAATRSRHCCLTLYYLDNILLIASHRKISMLGKNFMYVLMRTDGKCYKIGHTSSLQTRLRSLNRQFGPFSGEHSYAVRTRTKRQARKLEDALRTLLDSYSFTLPIGNKPNGQTEWFTGASFSLLSKNRESILAICLGDQATVEAIDVDLMAPLSELHLMHLRDVQKRIDEISSQLTSKWENAERTRKFIVWIAGHRKKFLGVAEVEKGNGKVCFELFLQPDACSFDELEKVRSLAGMNSDNADFFASTNFAVATSMPSYQKIAFVFDANPTIHEGSWESAGYVDEMHSILEDLLVELPLPLAYQKHVGVSFFDELTEEQRTDFGLAMRRWLLGED